jgi:hypothetical protein
MSGENFKTASYLMLRLQFEACANTTLRDAEFLGAQACSLCDALIRKQAVKKVISQDRNGD